MQKVKKERIITPVILSVRGHQIEEDSDRKIAMKQ